MILSVCKDIQFEMIIELPLMGNRLVPDFHPNDYTWFRSVLGFVTHGQRRRGDGPVIGCHETSFKVILNFWSDYPFKESIKFIFEKIFV